MSYKKGFTYENIIEFCKKYNCQLITKKNELDENTKRLNIISCCGHTTLVSFSQLLRDKIGVYCNLCFENIKINGTTCFKCGNIFNPTDNSFCYCSKLCSYSKVVTDEQKNKTSETLSKKYEHNIDKNGNLKNKEDRKKAKKDKATHKRRDNGSKEQSASSYENIKSAYEKKSCTLLTTKEELKQMLETKLLNQIIFKIISSCGHNDNSFYYTFKDNGTGIKCKKCTAVETSQNAKLNSKTHTGEVKSMLIEARGVDLIKELCKGIFDIEKTREGCEADILIRPTNEKIDKWLKVQLKVTTSPSEITSFNVTKRYTNMIVLLICVTNKKYWLFESNSMKIQKYHMGITRSKYDEYKIKNLCEEFKKWYNKDIYNTKLKIGNIPIALKAKIEYKYVLIREEKVKFINFVHNEIDGLVYDFKIGDKHIQEKVCAPNERGFLMVKLVKSAGGKNEVPYDEKDNDIYWLNVNHSTYFYVIPTSKLVQLGYVSTKKYVGDKYLNLTKSDQDYSMYLFNYDTINEEPNKQRLLHLIQNGTTKEDEPDEKPKKVTKKKPKVQSPSKSDESDTEPEEKPKKITKPKPPIQLSSDDSDQSDTESEQEVKPKKITIKKKPRKLTKS